jgi:hypothetical protein
MAKRLFLPGFTVILGLIIFIVFYAFSDGASELQASYPPFAYHNPDGWPTGTAASGGGATPSPMLFVPGLHKSAIGGPQKGLAWIIKTGRAVTDAVPFNISWYHTWGFFPPNLNPANPWPATTGAEFVPFEPCVVNPTGYPDHLSEDYTGYMLFLNEPDNHRANQCGGDIGPNDIISATEIYSDLVSKYPHAKLIGPNTTFEYHDDDTITGFLDAWMTRVITMGLPLPHGYGIHLYPSPTSDSAEDWTQAYCELLEEYDELDKELWVTEFGWSNDWVFETDPIPTQQATINEAIEDQFGFFETGLETDEEQECKITRYAWFTNRNKNTEVLDPGTPTPVSTPVSPVGYTDLYWWWTLTRSYTGNAYVDFGTLVPPTPTP